MRRRAVRHLARSGEHVNAADAAHDALGGGHPLVAGATDEVHRGEGRTQAVGHGRDGVRPSDLPQ